MTPDDSYLPRELQIFTEFVFGLVLAAVGLLVVVSNFGVGFDGPHPANWVTNSCVYLPVAAMVLWSLRYVLSGTAKRVGYVLASLVTLAWLGALLYVSTY